LNPHELTAFLSSTYVDLKEFREKVEEALSRVEVGTRSMPYFGSREGDPIEQCLAKLKKCNYYIGIIGHRYGSIQQPANLSYTEIEYREAKKMGIPRRIYLADATVSVQVDQIESDAIRGRLDQFKQTVKRENAVVPFSSPDDLATKVLADIVAVREEEIGSFLRLKYLPGIRRSSALISFLGLDIQSMKRHKDVKLQSVYVEPRLGARGTKSDGGSAPQPEAALAVGPSSASETLSVNEVLSRMEKLVILGDPGAGKSTLAKYLIVSLIDGDIRLGDRNDSVVPIKVPLKSYSEYRSRPEGLGLTILDFLRASTRTDLQLSELPYDFFEFYLRRKSAVVIFDGLDEIFDPLVRKQVRDDIDSFAYWSYPGNKIIVTSRKVGYEEVSFQQADFGHFEILPFNGEQVGEYVRKWYALEEPDKTKRKEEVRGLANALRNLPDELLGNPLLLSLIVILFRSGCTLPESKLEIYRSCVGTLTEKWDATGKRLELPAQYSIVRDKKSVFAHIGYWSYRRQTSATGESYRLRYSDVLAEVTKYLCEREFEGREGEAEHAAEVFLEYAARRSIFVEDRFSHKTFHEYFAALFIYRSFCVGKTVDDLYQEISPCLGSDSWSVVLELLVLMIDEQGGVLLDALLNKIIEEARSGGKQAYPKILVPLRSLGELQSVGNKVVGPLIQTAVEALLSPSLADPWSKDESAEVTHQKIFAAIRGIPSQCVDLLVESLRRAAVMEGTEDTVALIAAFHFEARMALPPLEEIVPSWGDVGQGLARRHLSIFYAYALSQTMTERISSFIRCFDKARLFEGCRKIFDAEASYRPFAEYSLLQLCFPMDLAELDRLYDEFLASPGGENLLPGLITRSSSSRIGFDKDPGIVVEHLSMACPEPKKYLLDYLLLCRLRPYLEARPARMRKFNAVLRRLSAKGSPAQKFYANIILGRPLMSVTQDELGVSDEVITGLMGLAPRRSTLRNEH
jgi:hypothetical protein